MDLPGFRPGSTFRSAGVCTKKKTILIIDDDTDFRASITTLLGAQGYRVIEASSAKEGLEKIVSQPPDLIVLDVILESDFAGYEVNQALRFRDDFQLARNIPILMASSVAIAPGSRFLRAADAGMILPNCYMTKPLNIKEFVEQVHKLLGTK
jgi:CheY-like chemotaxis protein